MSGLKCIFAITFNDVFHFQFVRKVAVCPYGGSQISNGAAENELKAI